MIKKIKKWWVEDGCEAMLFLPIMVIAVGAIIDVIISPYPDDSNPLNMNNEPEKKIITIERIGKDEYIIRDVEIEIKEARRGIRKPGLSVSKSTHTAQPIVRQANRKVSNGL